MMRRTSPSDVLSLRDRGRLAYALLRFTTSRCRRSSGSPQCPSPGWRSAELVVAHRVRAAVRHHPQAGPMTALAIARAVALGKATALVAAVVAGAAVALVAKLLPSSGQDNTAGGDLRVGYLLLVCTAGLLVAGLVLERAGVDPGHRSHRSHRTR